MFENICLWAAVSVLDLQGHTEQQERPDFEVHDLLQMNIHGVVGVVQGVSLDTKRSAGHDIQTERSHKPVTGRREDKRTRSVCSLKPDTVTSSRSPTFTLLPVVNLSANPDRSHSQATSHDLIRETKKRKQKSRTVWHQRPRPLRLLQVFSEVGRRTAPPRETAGTNKRAGVRLAFFFF